MLACELLCGHRAVGVEDDPSSELTPGTVNGQMISLEGQHSISYKKPSNGTMPGSGVANLQGRFFFFFSVRAPPCLSCLRGFQFIYTWIQLLVSALCGASLRI